MRLAVMLLMCGAALFAARPATEEIPTSAGPVKMTPIQHASLMLEAGGKVIYIDPAMGDYEGRPKADLILITDIHGDHMAPAVLAKVEKAGTTILAPEAVAKTVTSAKIIRNGETQKFDQWTIEAVPMYNLKRGPSEGRLFHDKGRGNGYVLTYGGKRFYFSGHTEGIPEMRALKNIDFAFVCFNLPYTMTEEQAAGAVQVFKPKIVYPYHYRGSDPEKFKKLVGDASEVRLRDWYKP